MIDEVDGASNSVTPRRESLPSLGMVAHIWAGHVGPVDVTEAADDASDVGGVELPSPRPPRVKVD